MQEEILKAIEKDLPNQVGLLLKEKLEQGESDAKSLILFKTSNIKYLQQIQDLKDELQETKSKLYKHGDLDVKIKELKDEEFNLKLKILTNKLEIEREKSKFAMDLGLGLVRNTHYRKTVFDNESTQIPVPDKYNDTRMEYVNNTKSYTEDKMEE